MSFVQACPVIPDFRTFVTVNENDIVLQIRSHLIFVQALKTAKMNLGVETLLSFH